jgi:hypothetical protein
LWAGDPAEEQIQIKRSHPTLKPLALVSMYRRSRNAAAIAADRNRDARRGSWPFKWAAF